MSLGRLILAWLPVALWFLAAGWACRRFLPAALPVAVLDRRWAAGTLGEATLVTLFASLWFDSLGSGGWWVLFLLVGLLAAELPRRPGVVSALVDAARYMVAGAILAWRLD